MHPTVPTMDTPQSTKKPWTKTQRGLAYTTNTGHELVPIPSGLLLLLLLLSWGVWLFLGLYTLILRNTVVLLAFSSVVFIVLPRTPSRKKMVYFDWCSFWFDVSGGKSWRFADVCTWKAGPGWFRAHFVEYIAVWHIRSWLLLYYNLLCPSVTVWNVHDVLGTRLICKLFASGAVSPQWNGSQGQWEWCVPSALHGYHSGDCVCTQGIMCPNPHGMCQMWCALVR